MNINLGIQDLEVIILRLTGSVTAAKYSLVKGFRPSVEVSESLPFLAVECSFPLKWFIKSKVTPGHMYTEL